MYYLLHIVISDSWPLIKAEKCHPFTPTPHSQGLEFGVVNVVSHQALLLLQWSVGCETIVTLYQSVVSRHWYLRWSTYHSPSVNFKLRCGLSTYHPPETQPLIYRLGNIRFLQKYLNPRWHWNVIWKTYHPLTSANPRLSKRSRDPPSLIVR